MLVAVERLFADHQQFHIFDAAFDHYGDPRLDWITGPRREFGYLAVERAIYVSTVAAFNTHRLRVYLDDEPPQGYERVFSATLSVRGEAIVFSAPSNTPDDDLVVPLAAGDYLVRICSRNLGTDELSVCGDRDEPLDDDEFLARDDIESYDVFVCRSPGGSPERG